ncbi:cysteine desulfurase [Gammaproteobacteria bacterium]|nr:cysteine desulfurase [Gammaproteobacteria bacterium]
MTYLDHAASTPVDPAVAAGMAAVLADPALQANPSSTHAAGDAARACVEQARAQVAALIGARPAEVVWTSGATEANNLAVIGAARLRVARGRHIVTAASEHASVLAACRELENQGFVVTRLATDAGGIVAPQAVAAALRADTTLVSLMQVNNETGVVQDVAAVGALCRSRGVLFHVDASQAAGREPIDVRSQAVDLLSLSAHKMYGPKGVGALFISRETARRVEPMLFGGGQERGLRPGTLATHQVAGMGLAAGLAAAQRAGDSARLTTLRDQLWQAIGALPGVYLNGHPQRRACHIVNVSVAGVDGESLLFAMRNLAVSSGAACAADSDEPSAVLRLLGRSPELAQAAVRFSLGRTTTADDVAGAAQQFIAAVRHLRRVAPAA